MSAINVTKWGGKVEPYDRSKIRRTKTYPIQIIRSLTRGEKNKISEAMRPRLKDCEPCVFGAPNDRLVAYPWNGNK